MYKVEARIKDSELLKVCWFDLFKPLPTAYREIKDFIGGKGEIERWYDPETMETVMVGIRKDCFPFQVWPLLDNLEND